MLVGATRLSTLPPTPFYRSLYLPLDVTGLAVGVHIGLRSFAVSWLYSAAPPSAALTF